jgi:hypothetical protein
VTGPSYTTPLDTIQLCERERLPWQLVMHY